MDEKIEEMLFGLQLRYENAWTHLMQVVTGKATPQERERASSTFIEASSAYWNLKQPRLYQA
jgi:hypothetical protein